VIERKRAGAWAAAAAAASTPAAAELAVPHATSQQFLRSVIEAGGSNDVARISTQLLLSLLSAR